MLKRYAGYFDAYSGVKIANICGSCGKKAVIIQANLCGGSDLQRVFPVILGNIKDSDLRPQNSQEIRAGGRCRRKGSPEL